MVLIVMLLSACGPKRYTGDSPYRAWLVDGESVLDAVEDGPFTLLHIDYRAGSGYLTSTHLIYYRIVYRDRIIVKEAERAGHWAGATVPSFFVEIYGDNGYALHVAREAAGKPVLQHLASADQGWHGEKGFEYGYPLSANVRYFPPDHPRGRGFLLHAAPFTVQLLPPVVGASGHGPAVNYLASIAPDGKSVAYVDGFVPPGMIMVSDDDGVIHDPILIPAANMAEREEGANSVARIMRWFPTAFTWERSSLGKWQLAQRANAHGAARPANPVEELFLDASIGYRNCFASTVASCLPDWRRDLGDNPREALADSAALPYFYVPVKPVQAFGANVNLLHAGFIGRPNYAVILDAPAAKVTAELISRLTSRNIPFVRSDQCPRGPEGWVDCAVPLHAQLGWTLPVEDELLAAVGNDPAMSTVFILPTLAVAVSARPDGMSLLKTVARFHPEHQRGKR
jgi:hypothetical protein